MGNDAPPIFIPPKKRATKKNTSPNLQNSVDFISNRNLKAKWDLTPDKEQKDIIPAKNKRWNSDEMIIEISHEKLKGRRDAGGQNDSKKRLVNGDSDDNELNHFGGGGGGKSSIKSSTATPSTYSESSLDATKSQECLTRGSQKKRVNIKTDIDEISGSPSTAAFNYEDLESGEMSILNGEADRNSLSRYQHHTGTVKSTDTYLTMTGTIKRGKKKGQSVDVQLNISREELEKINAAVALANSGATAESSAKHKGCCQACTPSQGLHVFALSVLCLPFVFLVTSIYSFYIGTLTWYNMFNYFNEEKNCFYKLLMSPLLIVAYPLTIFCTTFGLGLYAGVKQLTCSFHRWLNEIGDLEKGFYGWLCGFIHLSDCSPYEVVILMDIRESSVGGGAVVARAQQQQTEEALSL